MNISINDISLHLLDIVQNSLSAGSKHIAVRIDETDRAVCIAIIDDGVGIQKSVLPHVADPSYTTRTERGGLGLALYKHSTETADGKLEIFSRSCLVCHRFHGTAVYAEFVKTSKNALPLGDIVSTVCAILSGLGDVDMRFRHTFCGGCAELDTATMRKIIGNIPLSTPDVIKWAHDELNCQYKSKE